MGKDKKDRKPKSQKGPSSAAQAQQFLLQTGVGGLADAFTRFKQQGSSAVVSPSETTVASYDSISDPMLRQSFKHLSKKDPTTRLKALQQITTSIQEMKDPQEVVQILPEWISTMKKLSVDISRRVREQAFIAFKYVVQVVKKELGPYLKQIMGNWFIAMQDLEREVAAAAIAAFHTAFSEDKRKNVFEFCKDEILNQIKENLFTHTIQTLSSPDMTKTEAEDRYTNVVSSSLRALIHLLEELNDKNYAPIVEMCSQNALWKFLTIKEFPEVRAAAFKLVSAICKLNPSLFLTTANKEKIPVVNTHVSLNVIGCFSETSMLVHGNMVEALLTMLKTYTPEQIWGTPAMQLIVPSKAIFPRLFAFLRNPSTSTPSVTFVSLLPFISFLNYDILGGANAKSHSFFDQFFANLWAGFRSTQVQQSDIPVIFQTFVECLMYVVLQANKYVTEDDVTNLQQMLISKFLIDKSLRYYIMKRDVRKEEQMAQQLSKLIQKISSRTNMSNFANQIMDSLYNLTIDCLASKTVRITTEELPAVSEVVEADEEEKSSEKKQEKKPAPIVEEKIVCEDRNASVRKLQLLLSTLNKDVEAESKSILYSFAGKLFQYCLKTADQEDAYIYIQTCVLLASTFSLSTLIENQEALFASHFVPMFQLLVQDKTNRPNSTEFFNRLLELIAFGFVSFSEQASKYFDSIVKPLYDKPELLLYLLQKINAESEAMPFSQEVMDNVVSDIVQRVVAVKSVSDFASYVSLLEFLLIKIKVASLSTMQKFLTSVKNFILSKPQDTYLIRLLDLLQPLITHIFSTFQYADLKVSIVEELLPLLFDLRVYESRTIQYVSEEFKQECSIFEKKQKKATVALTSQEDQSEELVENEEEPEATVKETQGIEAFEELKTEQPLQVSETQQVQHVASSSFDVEEETTIDNAEYSALGERAQHFCDSIARRCLESVSDAVRERFVTQVTNRIAFLLSNSKISHKALFEHTVELSKLSSTADSIWQVLVLNEQFWEGISLGFHQVMKPVMLGTRVMLVPYVEASADNTKIVERVQLFARYLCYVIESLQHLGIEKVFLGGDQAVQHMWLLTELLTVYQTVEILNPNAVQLMKRFMNKELLPNAIWLTLKESDVSATEQAEQFSNRILNLCKYMLSKEQGKQQRHYMAIKTLIQATLHHLRAIYVDQKITIGTKLMRDLFKHTCSQLLFNKNLFETLSSTTASKNFYAIVDAFFTSYDDGEDDLLDFVVQKLKMDEQIADGTSETIITWLAQMSSILLKVTDEMKSEQYKQKAEESLDNTLTLMSALVILFNNLVGTDQEEIKVYTLIDIMKNFTDTLLDSEHANVYIDQVDFIFSKLLLSIIKRSKLTKEAVQTQQYEFIVTLIEQHFIRCVSTLQGLSSMLKLLNIPRRKCHL
jgi:hypothetical protein